MNFLLVCPYTGDHQKMSTTRAQLELSKYNHTAKSHELAHEFTCLLVIMPMNNSFMNIISGMYSMCVCVCVYARMYVVCMYVCVCMYDCVCMYV